MIRVMGLFLVLGSTVKSMTKAEGIEKLQAIYDKADKLANLVIASPYGRPQKEVAAELFQWLKRTLQAECKRMNPQRVQDAMSTTERAFYFPAITGAAHGAFGQLRVDAMPKKEWYSQFEGVRFEIGYQLDMLKKED